MKDTAKMTVPELKARAKELGLTGFSKLKKAELLEAVNTADAAPETLDQGDPGQVTPCQLPQLFNAAAQSTVNPLVTVTADQKRKARNKAKAARRRLRKQGFPAGFLG